MRQAIVQRKIDLFWSKVERTEDCWNWQGYINQRWGYGYVRINSKLWRVHRLSFTLLKGGIPSGKHLDHLCRNRICVNPDHLEPVTNKENVLRGNGITAQNERKTQCHNGHPLNGANLYITPLGYRNCKTCRKWANHARKITQA